MRDAIQTIGREGNWLVCPDHSELRQLVESGNHNVAALVAHYGVNRLVIDRWLKEAGVTCFGPPSASGEIWKPVVGFELQYEVSNLGNVRSRVRIAYGREYKARMRKQRLSQKGYKLVALVHKPGKNMYRMVHQLVLEAFVGPRPEGMVSCHGNGIKTDNRVENLRWDTVKANAADAIRHGSLVGRRRGKRRGASAGRNG